MNTTPGAPTDAQITEKAVLDHEYRKGYIDGQIDMRAALAASVASPEPVADYCKRPDIERHACEWPDCGRDNCRYAAPIAPSPPTMPPAKE